MNETERKEGESFVRYTKRIVNMAADKRIGYAEMGDALLGNENVYSEDNLRKAFYVLSKLCEHLEDEAVFSDSDILADIEEQKRQLEQEKVKFRDERIAYNVQNRNAARLSEKLDYLESVLKECGRDRLNFRYAPRSDLHSDNDLLIVLSDLHLGATFSNTFGEYNSDIAKKRLREYLSEILKIKTRHNSENAYIVLAGDLINNSIHKSIAITNRENVIDQIKLAVDYISDFCFEISKEFKNVYFAECAGNHSRIDRKEDALHDERLDSLISWTISKLLGYVDNFSVIEDGKIDTGIVKFNIRGMNYVAVHGDFDGMSKGAMARLVMMLGYKPYSVVMGHRHFPAVSDESGVRVIQNGSLCGCGDDYTVERRLTGKPSQTVCVCTDAGIECVYPVVFEERRNDA